jgi:hypothetical protein
LCEQNLVVKLNVQMRAARVLNPFQLYLEIIYSNREGLTLKGVSDPLRGELRALRGLRG